MLFPRCPTHSGLDIGRLEMLEAVATLLTALSEATTKISTSGSSRSYLTLRLQQSGAGITTSLRATGLPSLGNTFTNYVSVHLVVTVTISEVMCKQGPCRWPSRTTKVKIMFVSSRPPGVLKAPLSTVVQLLLTDANLIRTSDRLTTTIIMLEISGATTWCVRRRMWETITLA